MGGILYSYVLKTLPRLGEEVRHDLDFSRKNWKQPELVYQGLISSTSVFSHTVGQGTTGNLGAVVALTCRTVQVIYNEFGKS